MELRRALGLFDAYAIGVGAIIGAGIFVVTGAAAGLAGPALLLSLLIGAGISALTAFSFAELAMLIPKEGGGYEFAHELTSPLGGFVSGWMWLVSNVISGAVVAIGFAGYLAVFVPLPVNAIAALTCAGITAINLWGVRESTSLNDILVIFKIGVLGVFVLVGVFFLVPANYVPFVPHGPTGVMQGAAIIFFAYAGFGRVAMVSEEVVDPTRTVPKAILLSLATSTAIYMMVAAVALGLVGYQDLAGSASPLSLAAGQVGPLMAELMGVAAMAATLSVLLTTLLGISRLSFAMARNGDLPQALARVGRRTRTPVCAVLLFGALMAVFAFFSSLLLAAAIANFASLIYYALVNVSALRMPRPAYPRFVPLLGLATCLVLMAFLGLDAWAYGLVALLLILALYLVARRRPLALRPALTR